MKKLILALVIGLSVSGTASAATAYWTGQMQPAQSVTGMMVFNCQYMYGGNYFWRAFQSYCPSSIEIQ